MQYFSYYPLSKHYHDIYNRYLKCGEYLKYDSDGFVAWWTLDGLFHRVEDLPAYICVDGTQEWYKNGKFHREGDLPAIIDANGTKKWYNNNVRHREGYLPAVVYSDGKREYYKNGIYLRYE
jgi:hypothetical protein